MIDAILIPVASCFMAWNLNAIQKAVRWLNDPDVNKYLEARDRTWTMDAWRDWYKKQTDKGRTVYWIVLPHGEGKEVAGTLTIGPIDQKHQSAPIGLMVGKEYWRRGIGSIAIAKAARLGPRRVWAGVLSDNKRSIGAFQKAGFVIEGTLRQARRYGDGWMDEVVLGYVR